MQYKNCVSGVFLERPNRFIARVLVQEREVVVHVPNTGRCREILIPGTEVYLEPSQNPNRRTDFSLIAAKKGERLINIDSAAPNRVVGEALEQGLMLPGFPNSIPHVRREVAYGVSRLDFGIDFDGVHALLEVKGATLELDGAVFFPDAPTLRGLRHVQELTHAVTEGYRCYVFFLVQMEGVSYFSPNRQTHPEFAQALVEAREAGVVLVAYDCKVQPDSISLHQPVEIRL